MKHPQWKRLQLYLVSEPRISSLCKGIPTHYIVSVKSIVDVREGSLHHRSQAIDHQSILFSSIYLVVDLSFVIS